MPGTPREKLPVYLTIRNEEGSRMIDEVWATKKKLSVGIAVLTW